MRLAGRVNHHGAGTFSLNVLSPFALFFQRRTQNEELCTSSFDVPAPVILCLFFLSGATGLLYEVVWFKYLSVIWGNSTLASAAVTAAFMAGLTLGAWLIGRRSDFIVNPLRMYAALEVAIGLLALIVPHELRFLSWCSTIWYESLSSFPLAKFTVQWLTTFLVLGPPCVLMGGTLPLLVGTVSSRGSPDTHLSAAWLYGLNTLGGALGACLAGFVLLPRFGLIISSYVGVVLNLLIGVSAFVSIFWWRLPTVALTDDNVDDVQFSTNTESPFHSRLQLHSTFAGAFLTGFAGLQRFNLRIAHIRSVRTSVEYLGL